MAKKENLILEWAVLAVVVISALVFLLHLKNQEINLCRRLFNGLVKGSYGVVRLIDWDNLKALDVDVAATYAQLPNEAEKTNYKKAFIKGFSAGFRQIRGRLKEFARWRIYDRDSEKTVVAADYLGQNKTLLFTFLRYGRPKLIAIQWEE